MMCKVFGWLARIARVDKGVAGHGLVQPKYRPDIDGLRAIAVLSVVGFHAFPERLPGGFIGVDVFFVISGYLISTIIVDSLRQGHFSFSAFYARRIRRIFPALLLVLVATGCLGWLLLFADEYRQLGKHVATGAFFVANIGLWHESGYFDLAAETKPLLHLWSLGIEEQFYIVAPLLLWLAWRQGVNRLVLIVLVALSSFSLNLAEVGKDATAAFYSPQTRFWELLCGSMLSWAGQAERAFLRPNGQALSNMLSLSGFSLLVLGVLAISRTTSFPGAWALIPVTGAAFIIRAGPQAWLNRKILSARLAVGIGLISYPLYLWHWPLLSFLHVMEGGMPEREARLVAVLLAFVLAWLTSRFVEPLFRSGGQSKRKALVLVCLMSLVGGLGYAIYRQDGPIWGRSDRDIFVDSYENSFPTWRYFARINVIATMRGECGFFNIKKYLEEGDIEGGVTDSKPVAAIDPSCYVRDARFDKSVLIWGDSHAQTLAPGLRRYLPRQWQMLQVASPGCRPSIDIEKPSTVSQCDQSNYFALKTIAEVRPDVVVLAQVDGHSARTMARIAGRLEQMGVRKVLFLGPVPQWRADLPRIFARQLWLTRPVRTYTGIKQETLDSNERLLQTFRPTRAAEYVNIIGLFCDASGCLTHTDANINESMTTSDYGHLTPAGSEYLARNLLVARIVAP